MAKTATKRSRKKPLWPRVRRFLMILLAAVFLFCGGTVAVVQHQYAVNKRLYREAAASFTTQTAPAQPDPSLSKESDSRKTEPESAPGEKAPIEVDFDALRKVNPDVCAWIYCPDTVINYPVVHGDADFYLHHSYDGTFNASGSIFVDPLNSPDFTDPLSILYGHHMASGAMFATLDRWQAVDYFYEHPVMWLLTPDRDYKVELCSAYNTSAYSDTYSFFDAHDSVFAEYLRMVFSSSAVRTGAEADPESCYILLSTCAYVFEDARSVLHGRLVPLASAGGRLITQ